MTDSNGAPAESSLIRATAKNIEGLQRAVVNLQNAASQAGEDAKVAQMAAAQAREEARRWKILTRVLGFFVLVSLIASGLSTYNWVQAVQDTNQLRTQAIASCNQGNDQRRAQVNVWDHILNEFLVGTTTETPAEQKATAAFVKGTEQYLAMQLAPRNCTQAYNVSMRAGD